MTNENYTPIIPGYQIVSQLYAGARTKVYQAIRQSDSLAVIIKMLAAEYPSFHELLQFRNQHTISKYLKIPGIIQPLSLDTYGNGYILVMSYTGDISLQEYIKNTNLCLLEFLNIAIQLITILHELHHNRVIHKDIKPANILINPQTKQVQLIDFSIASLLPKESPEIKNPNVLEGTLAYIAPEQTGRMNRGIDYRSDYYALGVTFYELLSGELPFVCNDPMELVHCHLAKIPKRLENSKEIPKVISDIVMKLLAKNAEGRYQSALGLKHDLENCLYQLKNHGVITEFVIGKRDVCDRFLIPEKLYGREVEVSTLLQAFERIANGNSEMMLVAGFSGIGKTAVVNEVHKPITRKQGYFIKGKFDQFNRNIPFSAFVQVFRDLMGQLLAESDTQLQIWKNKIIGALGDNAQVIIEVIPELERIIGAQPPAPELSGISAQNRFNLLFEKFIQVFTTPEHPLVIFLDDLQWADSASLKLIELLMGESSTGYLLLIGAYRDNEVFAAHPLMLTLDAIAKAKAKVNTITLKPLSQQSLNQLVADTLHCAAILAQPLTELIYQKTQGNPFFTTQFLKALHQDGLITFDSQTRYWQCDITQVSAAALTDDVVQFMAQQLQKLPVETQEVLKLAACIGNQFDLGTLAIVLEQSETTAAIALWKALQLGLILPQSEVYKFYLSGDRADIDTTNNEKATYKFLHDRVQQAAYSLIPNEQKQTTHLTIGQLLLKHTNPTEITDKIFDIVNQFKLSIDLITDYQEQRKLAELALIAGRRAKHATAYAGAVDYYSIARTFLANHNWQDFYELLLAVYTEAVEAAYLNTDFEQMEQLAEIVLKYVNNILDVVPIYETKILACVAKNQLRLGLDIALAVLHDLGIDIPAYPTQEDIGKAMGETHQILVGKEPLELVNLPLMTDARTKAAIRILSSMFGTAYNGCPEMLPLIVSQQVNLSIEYGNTTLSAFAYANYGLILCAFTGAVETSYQFGQLALNLIEQFSAEELRAKITAVFNNFIRHWQDPLQTILESLLAGYQSGLTTGDLEWAVWCIFGYSFQSYCAGKELTELEAELATYGIAIAELKQTTALNYHKAYHQAVLNLLGCSEVPYRLVGNVYNEDVMLPQHQEVNDRPAVYHVQINKVILCYLFGEYEQAIAQATLTEQYLDGVPGLYVSVLLPFYDALAQLAILKSVTEESSHSWQRVQNHQTKLKQYADYAPNNHLHKLHLVEAECCRVSGDSYTAMELYDRAIKGAKENGYLQEEALANELAAKFYLDGGKEKVAAGYMQSAYYCYSRWGAKAKTDDLANRYPDLLRPILQQTSQSWNPLETLATLATPHISVHASTNITQAVSQSLNTSLDFAAVLKASQSLSSTIHFDELLRQLTQIILQNSGGDRCALILPNSDGNWYLQAIATPDHTELCSQPLEGNCNIPVKLIQYVKNTQEVVVIEHLKTDLPVIDEYLTRQQPQSILCLPILHQGNLIGILYLQNRSTSGVFTSDRILILDFLCTQAAISLENARLYQQIAHYSQNLEAEVEQKTQALNQKAQDLEDTLQHLQKTHAQLIHSEKMSSLGQLVAGIAHEINNPISFIKGNIDHLETYLYQFNMKLHRKELLK
ncbi:AAA family ATPase [Tolypothrix sp. PCC 7910]|uniref:ATP-binding protein n=1 Tax=Tolypothrix sp. PCC 7910 TaxID=2099387 RepID=UPI00142781F8|nr:AAA family ATPase [Tolypothrix sp. PCC 7910]QIR36434.1 AAA family ATPase [Tolypothrix sp. PCC 7910]